jgi:hypothetical protein
MSKLPSWAGAYARTVGRWVLGLVLLLLIVRALVELVPLASHLYTVF